MRRRALVRLVLVLLVVLLAVLSAAVAAEPPVVGLYQLTADCESGCAGTYPNSMDIKSYNSATGEFSGTVSTTFTIDGSIFDGKVSYRIHNTPGNPAYSSRGEGIVNASGDWQGSGTDDDPARPPAQQHGTFTFSAVRLSSPCGAAPVFSPARLPTGEVGLPYEEQVSTTPYANVTIDSLDVPGLVRSSADTLDGTPSRAGRYVVHVTAVPSNSQCPATTKYYVLTIRPGVHCQCEKLDVALDTVGMSDERVAGDDDRFTLSFDWKMNCSGGRGRCNGAILFESLQPIRTTPDGVVAVSLSDGRKAYLMFEPVDVSCESDTCGGVIDGTAVETVKIMSSFYSQRSMTAIELMGHTFTLDVTAICESNGLGTGSGAATSQSSGNRYRFRIHLTENGRLSLVSG